MPGDVPSLEYLSSVGLTMKSDPSVKDFILGSSVGIVPFELANAVSTMNSDPSRDNMTLLVPAKSGSGVGSSIFLNGVAGPGSPDDDAALFIPLIWLSPGKEVLCVMAMVA
jgi:hypothetical protein